MTRDEVARIFRIQPDTLDGWARTGRITAVRLPSGRRRFRREDIEALVQRGLEESA